VPSSPIAFLQFLKQVRDSGVLDENVGPPVIHCSAGIGRSGTFCLVDCCLVLVSVANAR
jgi:tyrosine-protein phosphatase non-receptor type 1